jgi:RNA polymerase sigma factor (sigma-70 family)
MGINPADLLLRQFAESTDHEHAEALLESIVVEHAQPGIRKIVRYKLAFRGASEAQDIEDVASEVLVELIARLRSMKESAACDSIGALSGYTAVAAYHACNEYLRRKHPNRHRLKTRLRYLLHSERRFSIWEDASAEWMCGLRCWLDKRAPRASQDRMSRWSEVLADVPRGRTGTHPADVLAEVFRRLGGPVEFDELVNIMGQIWGVDDPPPVSEISARDVESPASDPGLHLEQRQWLARLWEQIRSLPVAQRVALLLNLRCEAATPAVLLLPITGVASVREIAETLEFSPEEFAAIWNRLPLEDLAIAERLGVTRQQVINLRKSARERLARRMGSKHL